MIIFDRGGHCDYPQIGIMQHEKNGSPALLASERQGHKMVLGSNPLDLTHTRRVAGFLVQYCMVKVKRTKGKYTHRYGVSNFYQI